MKNYNYLEEMVKDIYQYVKENKNYLEIDWFFQLWENDFKTKLYDRLRTEDSITWNASGSYTMNTYEAMENVSNNQELLEETINEFWIDMSKHRNDYEYLDVSIRCYLLSQAIEEFCEEYVKICDECWNVMIEWYYLDWEYLHSEEELKEKYTEEEIKEMEIWEDESENYRTTRVD